jgi:regulator of sirC expression with transglutaminase-like and TPR domain
MTHRFTAFEKLYAKFAALTDTLRDAEQTEQTLDLLKKASELHDALEAYNKATERDIEQKEKVHQVLMALVSKHWKVYRDPQPTPAHRAAAAAHLNKMVREFDQKAKQTLTKPYPSADGDADGDADDELDD